MPRRIILDCDPGHDDAIALLLAHGSPEIQLAAVTDCRRQFEHREGDQERPLRRRDRGDHRRALRVRGDPSARPHVEFAATIHGDSGLDGPVLPDPDLSLLDPRGAVRLIIDTVMASAPGEITLVADRAADQHRARRPDRASDRPRVREVVFMGGGVHVGNWNATSEFDIVVDPEAAHIVIGEAWPVTMVGLDVTHQAVATPAVRERIAAVGSAPAAFVGELLDFFGATYLREQGFLAPPVHDPVAVAYVIDPSVLEVRAAPLDVELSGTLTLGMTVADLRAPAPADCTTHVSLGIDDARFWDLVVDAFERIG